MDNVKLIFPQNVSSAVPLKQFDKVNLDGMSEERKKQVAKDFESLLINKLLDEMKNTIGDWGFEKDGVSMQVQGIFWLYLARDIANNGGLGLWKDIYQTLVKNEPAGLVGNSMDNNL